MKSLLPTRGCCVMKIDCAYCVITSALLPKQNGNVTITNCVAVCSADGTHQHNIEQLGTTSLLSRQRAMLVLSGFSVAFMDF